MHYPVNVFVGKVRDYDGSRPSAIGKIQVDGELTLGDLGLEGDEQAEKKIHGGPDRALCHYPREHYAHWARELPQQADSSAPRRLAKISRPKGSPKKTSTLAISSAGEKR